MSFEEPDLAIATMENGTGAPGGSALLLSSAAGCFFK